MNKRSDLARVVNHIAQAGDAVDAGLSGTFRRFAKPRQSYGDVGFDLSLWHLAWQQALPAAEPLRSPQGVDVTNGNSPQSRLRCRFQLRLAGARSVFAARHRQPRARAGGRFAQQLLATGQHCSELGKLDELKQLTEQAIASKLTMQRHR